MLSLQRYAELAHSILNSETQYLSNKEIISALFKSNNSSNLKSVVKNRITIIDSYYSTQMSKRLYGIDELAYNLAQYPDDILKIESHKFLNNPDKETVIKSLFSKEYGIDKSGEPFGKSISLISKYLYFLNDGNFPIYDSLAIDAYKLFKKNDLVKTKVAIGEENYFDYMKQLNTLSNINNYEKLDNLLWLTGKLSKGSFAILMTKDKYEGLVTNLKNDLLKANSKQKDNIIRNHIKKIYSNSDLFTNEQKSFFEFVFSLT